MPKVTKLMEILKLILLRFGEDLPKSSAVLLNSLSTLTATADDLNVLTGTTATAAEINYLTGVTDPIKGQIDLRLTETLADTLYMRKGNCSS